MEVHKHPHHVTHKKKFGEYLLEFLMLFLAVFLGFIAENVREHYVERHRVKQYARSLIHDLEQDTAMINLTIRQIQSLRNFTDSFSTFLRDRKLQDIRNIDLYILTRRTLYRPFSWSRATIEQIKNSGSLRYFSNDSIINRISAYDALTRHLDDDFRGDEESAGRSAARRSQIVDLNYPDAFSDALDDNIDSMLNTDWFKTLAVNGPQLLTNDLNQIKVLLNERISNTNALDPRINRELPEAMTYAKELIQLLRKEYHFK